MEGGNVGYPKRATRNNQPKYQIPDQDNKPNASAFRGYADEDFDKDDEHETAEATNVIDAEIEEMAQKPRSKKSQLGLSLHSRPSFNQRS